MNISSKTIAQLVDIITGDTGKSPPRDFVQLEQFFRGFGKPYMDERYWNNNDISNTEYVQDTLWDFNGKEEMKKIVAAAFDFLEDNSFNAEEAAETFSRQLSRDGYRLVSKPGVPWMDGKQRKEGNPYFEVKPIEPIEPAAVVTTGLLKINHHAINEQISKVDGRLEREDCSGAIASSYTLIEQLLKLILREEGISFIGNEGSILDLYKLVREPLNLNPAGQNIGSSLKPILEGLQKLVSGLYEASNKASDRHARKYNPAEHHAKLARNTAYTLCEFLVESRDYQKKLKNAPSPKTDVGKEKT